MSSVKYWKYPGLDGLELCLADHAGFTYGRHIHLDYHIGLVELGAQKFIHKGSSSPLAPGQLSLLNPDIAHDGSCFDEQGFRVRVFSIAPELMAGLAEELQQATPYFGQPLLNQPRLYRQSLTLHRQLEQATWLIFVVLKAKSCCMGKIFTIKALMLQPFVVMSAWCFSQSFNCALLYRAFAGCITTKSISPAGGRAGVVMRWTRRSFRK